MCEEYLKDRIIELEEKGTKIPDGLTPSEYAVLIGQTGYFSFFAVGI